MGYRPRDPLDPEERERWPWEDPAAARATVFVALGATGADPAVDGVLPRLGLRRRRAVALGATGADPAVDGLFRLSALRRGSGGAWERFERFCDPFPGESEPAATQ